MKKEFLGVIFQLFLDSQNMKIFSSTCLVELVKGNENTSTQYKLNILLEWDRLTMKEEYLTWTWLRGSLGYYFFPFWN